MIPNQSNRNKLEEQTGTSCRNKEEGLFARIAMADVDKFCNVVTGMIPIVAGAVAKAEVFIIGVAAERNKDIFTILFFLKLFTIQSVACTINVCDHNF